MQIAQQIGGYTSPPPLARKAMGKKLPEEMATSTIFVRAPEQRDASQGDGAFDLMEVRRLRLQQVACRRLCAHRASDGLVQGPLPVGVLAANLSLVMDDTDKVKPPRRRDAQGLAGRRPTSMRRTIGSSPSTRSGSATAWAASKAPAKPRSQPSSPRAPPVAHIAICSISAVASTSVPSTGVPWKR
jgi:hypothetical protein